MNEPLWYRYLVNHKINNWKEFVYQIFYAYMLNPEEDYVKKKILKRRKWRDSNQEGEGC